MINCILIQHQPGKPSPPLTCWTVLSPLTDWSFPMECKYVCDTAQSRPGPRQPNYVRRWQKMRGEKLQGLLGCVSQHHLNDELYSSTLTLTQISNWQSLKCELLCLMKWCRRGEVRAWCRVNMSSVWAHHYPALVRLMPETGGYFPLSSTLGNILLIATCALLCHPWHHPTSNHRESRTVGLWDLRVR